MSAPSLHIESTDSMIIRMSLRHLSLGPMSDEYIRCFDMWVFFSSFYIAKRKLTTDHK